MPKEIIQFAAAERDDSTSIEVVWSKPEAGGSLQLRFQRHTWARIESTGELVHSAAGDPVALHDPGEPIRDFSGKPITEPPENVEPTDQHGMPVAALQQRLGVALAGVERIVVPCPVGVDEYSDQLSRDDCNRLIRALRRARDQVYGADA